MKLGMSTPEGKQPADPPEPVHMQADDYASKKLEPGQLLWHYTRDFNGLSGILGGEIWATSLPCLNDTEEFQYGARVALDALREVFDDNEHMRELWKHLSRVLLINFRAYDVFSISFSTEKDDLSQWRAYSGTGPSFSIGFHPQSLELHANGYLFQLHEVKYDKKLIAEDVKSELQEEVARLNDEVRMRGASIPPVDFARRVGGASLVGQLLQMAPRYKHPKFSAEKEWRLIRFMPVISRSPRLPRHYRLSGSLIAPYVALPLHTPKQERDVADTGETATSPIVAVMSGPSPHPQDLKYAIGDMTARMGLALIDITSSEVPFRNW